MRMLTPRRGLPVHEGTIGDHLPCLTIGTGPPLVVLTGLTAEHANPTGIERWMQVNLVRPFAEAFAVHLVNRRPGLPAGTTMGDLAADAAAAIRGTFDRPVAIEGISTGGSIALTLAIDHPDVVRRLVVASAACRLAPLGRAAQRRLADLTLAGQPRRAWAALAPAVASGPAARWAMATAMWLTGTWSAPEDPADMVATIRAEDALDVCADLHRITAPTLVVGGGRDGFYRPELFRLTARGIPDARLLLYPDRSHAGVLSHRPAQQQILRFLATADARSDGSGAR